MEVKCRIVEEVFYKRCDLCRLLLFHSTEEVPNNGGRVHYVIVSKIQWKPFWLATQLYPQNDWTEWQFCVNVCTHMQTGPIGVKRLQSMNVY